MEKKPINVNFFMPMPVVLVGARVNGKDNFMPVGWCSRGNANPPMIMCGIGNHHHTLRGIIENQSFSVNIPPSGLLEKTDYCGLVSGARIDKSGVFTVFHGTLPAAPMIRECPVTLECRLVSAVPLPTNTVCIGEIVGAFADEQAIKEGKPDFPSIDPLFLTMPDNRYWTLGSYAGDAWSAGRKLLERTDTGVGKGKG
jgi:flavin reductase (DIM6/NTAB) family NADH-FMN oxidoreductase RutF